MKIKLAVLDKEQSYLERISTSLGHKYNDKLEIYCFTDMQKAVENVIKNNIDVFFASFSYEIDTSVLPERCGFAYLVDTKDVDLYNGERAVCKFQKLENIHNYIIDIYTDKNDIKLSTPIMSSDMPVYVFTSAVGGCGTSVAASAFSISLAKEGKKVIYLNLEKFGNTSFYFDGEGQYDLRDILIAIKSGKSNISMKLESMVKKDKTNVSFISSPQKSLDIATLTAADIKSLIELFKTSGAFDCVVIDIDFEVSDKITSLFNLSHAVILVSDASEKATYKIQRAYEAVSMSVNPQNAAFLDRIVIFYNRVKNSLQSSINIPNVRTIGASPEYNNANVNDIMRKMVEVNAFKDLLTL